MPENQITAYEGPENYIFISYAHKDTRKVFPIMEELCRRGYRIWYDDGIAPGSEWPENIAQHLNGCAVALAFVSPNSMASVNCRREINFALSKQKPFLSVILEPTEMPLGMELQLSAQQSVLRYNYRSNEQFIEKICACPDLASCREYPVQQKPQPQPAAVAADNVSAETVSQPVPVPPAASKPQPETNVSQAEPDSQDEEPRQSTPPAAQPPKKNWLIPGIAAGVIALAVIAAVLLFAGSGAKKESPSANAGEFQTSKSSNVSQSQTTDEQSEEYTVHVRIPQSWKSAGLWAWEEPGGREAFDAWPGPALKMGEDGWYTGTVPTWANCVSISGNDGTMESQYVLGDSKEVWISVREDWSCQYSYDGPFEGTVTIHASVPDSWGDPHCWAWADGKDVFDAWPGGAMTPNGDWYTIELPNWTEGVVINSETIQTNDLVVEPGWDVWVVVRGEYCAYFYEEPTEADIRAELGS